LGIRTCCLLLPIATEQLFLGQRKQSNVESLNVEMLLASTCGDGTVFASCVNLSALIDKNCFLTSELCLAVRGLLSKTTRKLCQHFLVVFESDCCSMQSLWNAVIHHFGTPYYLMAFKWPSRVPPGPKRGGREGGPGCPRPKGQPENYRSRSSRPQ
jgi:hypothetical protein